MEGRRRITLYDRMTAGNSTSLADLILHDNAILSNQAAAAATTALTDAETCQLRHSRTLVDILREEEWHGETTSSDRKFRRAFNFMDKLRLKLTLTSKSNYNSDNSKSNDNNSHNNLSELETRLYSDELTQQQQQQQQNDVVAEEPENPPEVAVAGPVGVSLMDLLEETDMETGFEVSSFRMSNADYYYDEDVTECEEGEEKGEEEEERGASVVERSCCVCMVRHKGAALIPCGHTFCRTCSREVWVNRGNCPLCNNFILEILDIF